jgi:hypothetical protein
MVGRRGPPRRAGDDGYDQDDDVIARLVAVTTAHDPSDPSHLDANLRPQPVGDERG